MLRRYNDLVALQTFDERFAYLRLTGVVGARTFGSHRDINQTFYHSREWRDIRQFVIQRDYGYDMGLKNYPIAQRIIVHHMNPIMDTDDFYVNAYRLLDPEFLISVSHETHLAIHYGRESSIMFNADPVVRFRGDTILW